MLVIGVLCRQISGEKLKSTLSVAPHNKPRKIGQTRATLGRTRDREKGKIALSKDQILEQNEKFKDKAHVDKDGVPVRCAWYSHADAWGPDEVE